MSISSTSRAIIIILLTSMLLSCNANTKPIEQSTQSQNSTTAPQSKTQAIEPTPTQSPLRLFIQPEAAFLIDKDKFPQNVILAPENSEADVTFTIRKTETADDTLLNSTPLIFALVAPFPTVLDQVSLSDLKSAWHGTGFQPMDNKPLLMDEKTEQIFEYLWDSPAIDAVKVLDDKEILDYAWSNRPAWAIVPFEQLESRWKVLSIDNVNPLQKDLDITKYGLAIPVDLRVEADVAVEAAKQTIGGQTFTLPWANRDESKITTLVMTGVTALVRGTAYIMNLKGVTYPGKDIRDWLRNADITHISNEVSFYEGCPPPNPNDQMLYFCTDPKFIQLLEDVGTDIVELTGNHNNDARQMYGSKADPARYSLDLYRERGWQYFGGGENIVDSRKPALIEHNGNKLAFIGCNPSGPTYAWATETDPGAAPCDDYEWLHEEVSKLKSEGYIPIVTFQYFENYSNQSGQYDRRDFRGAADSGAVIVSGSQAHVAKGMEFYQNAFIHYGLGNLFFDQMHLPNTDPDTVERWEFTKTRREFIDRYTFYNGKLLSIELLTAMLEDQSKPRPMTQEERAHFLQDTFIASKLVD